MEPNQRPSPPEAVKNSPLVKAGGGIAARGLSCELGKALAQRNVSQMASPSSLGLPVSRDNPCAFGAAPFPKIS